VPLRKAERIQRTHVWRSPHGPNLGRRPNNSFADAGRRANCVVPRTAGNAGASNYGRCCEPQRSFAPPCCGDDGASPSSLASARIKRVRRDHRTCHWAPRM